MAPDEARGWTRRLVWSCTIRVGAMERGSTSSMSEQSALAAMAVALDRAGHWAEIVDRRWRYVHMTDELRVSFGGHGAPVEVPLGEHYFGASATEMRFGWRRGPRTPELLRADFAALGGWLLADTPGGRDDLRRAVDPAFRDLVDNLPSDDGRPALSYVASATGLRGLSLSGLVTALRVRDTTGELAGTALVIQPLAGMSVLATVTAGGDLQHFARMQRVAEAARRPAAMLFADLEGSSALARRLSTTNYFSVGRRLVAATDQIVVDAGGIVGRHVGDGVVAFFLAETAGSESAAARACIAAARTLQGALAEVARRSNLAATEVVLRFGLHWGSTLYVGQIATSGRTEVTALGDEVNETA